jgi:heme-degrading monooxygenase HmoA
MEHTQSLFTLGNWTVKQGCEAEFITAWKAFAVWSSRHQPGSGTANLLQDAERPQVFVSYGSWDSADTVKAWRSTPEFQAFLGKVRSLCESFTPHAMNLVARSTS